MSIDVNDLTPRLILDLRPDLFNQLFGGGIKTGKRKARAYERSRARRLIRLGRSAEV